MGKTIGDRYIDIETVQKDKRLTQDQIKLLISLATYKHAGVYDYSLINIKRSTIYLTTTLIPIKCSVHGVFKQDFYSHINTWNLRKECPLCQIGTTKKKKDVHVSKKVKPSKGSGSKGEQVVENFLKSKHISYSKQKTFNDCVNPKTGYKLRFDFYLTKHNMCIEFDGHQHFKESIGKYVNKHKITKNMFKQTSYRDSVKNLFCKKNSIRLLRIKFTDDVEQLLTESLHI